MLVNRLTAVWYINKLAENTYKFRGFIEFSKGNGEDALKYYKKMAGLSVDVASNGSHNDLYRLSFGATRLYMIAMPEDLKLYKGKQAMLVKLADFYYVTRQWKKSLKILSRLQDGHYGSLSKAQMDYVHLLRGMVYYRNADGAFGEFRNKSISEMREVLKKREMTHAELRATFYIAQTLREIRSKDEDQREIIRQERKDLLTELSKSNHEAYKHKALIELARDYANQGEQQQAIDLLIQVVESGGMYSAFAEELKKQIETDIEQE